MRRTTAFMLAAVLVGGAAGGCATAGPGGGGSDVPLSTTRYSAEDLARVPHDNLYDFLRDHSRVRVGQSGDRTPLAVRHRGRYVAARLYVENAEVASPIFLLRQTDPRAVASLEILDPSEANSVFGRQGRFGVVAITMQ